MTEDPRAIDVSVLADLIRIRHDEDLLKDRLQKMEESRERVSAVVYQRVRGDYEARRSTLEAQARSPRERAGREYAKLRVLVTEAERSLQDSRLENEELEFRHTLGEFVEEEFQSRLAAARNLLGERQTELDRLNGMREEFRGAFGSDEELDRAATAAPPYGRSEPQRPAAPAPRAAPPPPMPAAPPEPSRTFVPQQSEPSRTFVPQSEPQRSQMPPPEPQRAYASSTEKRPFPPQTQAAFVPQPPPVERTRPPSSVEGTRPPVAPISVGIPDATIAGDFGPRSQFAPQPPAPPMPVPQPPPPPAVVAQAPPPPPPPPAPYPSAPTAPTVQSVSAVDTAEEPSHGATMVMSLPRVAVIYEDKPEEEYVLKREPTHIGRLPRNTIQLPFPDVSREHATIVPEGARYKIQDKGSENGIYVNGDRVSDHLLADGDVIQIGRRKLVFRT